MSSRFLILHGFGNRRPRGHWQHWLADQLRRRGERVRYPQLPDPDRPDLTAWLDALGTEYAQLGDRERVVICHSLACALWYQASELSAGADAVAGRSGEAKLSCGRVIAVLVLIQKLLPPRARVEVPLALAIV